MRPQLRDVGFGGTRTGHHGDRVSRHNAKQDKDNGNGTCQCGQGQQQAVDQIGVTHQDGTVLTTAKRKKS